MFHALAIAFGATLGIILALLFICNFKKVLEWTLIGAICIAFLTLALFIH